MVALYAQVNDNYSKKRQRINIAMSMNEPFIHYEVWLYVKFVEWNLQMSAVVTDNIKIT